MESKLLLQNRPGYIRIFTISLALAVFISCQVYAKPLSPYRMRRNALKDKSVRWPNATVVYTIEANFSKDELATIKKAMKDISSVSCIRFKERTNEYGYVRFIKEEGCWANVGYLGYPQRISLGPGCYRLRTAIHELFHTLGFHHEHTRPDRDNYVLVEEDNVDPDELHNFHKKSFKHVTTLGLPYDFKSVLHYHDRSFAKKRTQKTLKSTRGEDDINEAQEMSLLDIMRLNLLYRCLR